ncbi:hypothetical protein [Pseudomonas sp. DY-1]|uniref:hypothetical protein n=1 Tax=Pseudomonas sp. DY-1 TaxID=1755504 RepID=UPI0013C4BE4B|nr:hypothetical protein [Pseudomonas sp. DY-1]
MKVTLFGTPLRDEVLGAAYWVGYADYAFAIDKLFPLIQSLTIQRNLQNPSFYSRLRNDLKIGCVIPPITIAFIIEGDLSVVDERYINEKISDGFVLDGIQRLNAIQRAFNEIDGPDRETFLGRTLHLNIIVAPSMDRLLYRMITLNNGQKPMSPRHQIDILSETIFDFETLSLKNQSHKSRQVSSNKLHIQRSDIVKGYIAFLASTPAIDNKLIIEEKMDDLIAERIIDSNISVDKFEFIEVLGWVADRCVDVDVNKWFVSGNNFIGFCAAARKNFEQLRAESTESLACAIERFESVFLHFDKKKIKVGDYRRKMVYEYFGEIGKFSVLPDSDVVIELSQR